MSSGSTSAPPVQHAVVTQYKDCWRELNAKLVHQPNLFTLQCLEEIGGGIAFSQYIKDMALGLVHLIAG